MSTRRHNGEGTKPTKRKDGRWQIKIRTTATTTGAPVRKTIYGKTRAEAVDKARKFTRSLEAGALVDPTAKTLGQWCTTWLETIAPATTNQRTLLSYKGYLRKWVIETQLGQTPLAKLVPTHIDQLHATMRAAGKSETTINLVHRIITKAITDALDRGLLGANPAQRVKAPRPARFDPVVLTPAQAAALVADLKDNEQWGPSFIVALSLGLRQGERLGLCWEDIDFQAGTMRIRRELGPLPWQHGCSPDGTAACGKSRGGLCPQRHGGGLVMFPTKSKAGERTLALPEQLLQILATQQQTVARWRIEAGDTWEGFTDSTGDSWDLVFPQRNGRPIGDKQDRKAWKAFTEAHGIEGMRVHDARHTAATVLLSLGVAPQVTMAMMGWSNASMLGRYQHVLDDMRTEAAARVGGALFDTQQAPLDGGDGGGSVVSVDFRSRKRA